MNIPCDVCGLPLEKLGGLMFSPPMDGLVEKTHLCVDCWYTVKAFCVGMTLRV